MKLELVRLTPTINPKPQAFADYKVTFSGGEKILIKGVKVKFYKSKMQIILPKLKHEDPKKKNYSPLLFVERAALDQFMLAASKEITVNYPLIEWGKGIYVRDC